MVHNFPNGSRQLFNALESADYIITGSLALEIYEVLGREISDVDLITTDQKVLDIMRGKGFDMSDAFPHKQHYRFHFKDMLFVDIFFKHQTPYEIINIGNRDYKVTPPWYVYMDKLTNIFVDKEKAKQDILHYYELQKLKWRGPYM